MAIGPTAGSKLYIGTNESTPSPDDYIEIGEIADLGEFGRQYQEIVAQTLGTRGDRKFKGTYNEGTMNVQLLCDPSDAGQVLAAAALLTDYDYNFKVTLNDDESGGFTTPTTVTFKAKVMSFPMVGGGPNNMVRRNCQLSIKSGSLVEIPAA